MRSNGNILFSAMGSILKSLWKLFLLMTYIFCKATEQVAGFLAKLCERYVN